MKVTITNPSPAESARLRGSGRSGFTMIEALITMALLVILVTATLSAIGAMQMSSSRVGDYNAAMAILEARANDVRAWSYSPPASPFTTGTVTYTNQYNLDLNSAGTTFQVPGTVTTKIQYCGSMGHLVTITGTFQSPSGGFRAGALTVSLQTFVNGFSGGQQ